MLEKEQLRREVEVQREELQKLYQKLAAAERAVQRPMQSCREQHPKRFPVTQGEHP